MKSVISILILILFISSSANAQLFRKKKTSDPTVRNGVYYEYWDRDSTKLSAKGYFCDNKPCKTWKYYWEDGIRRMKVKYKEQLKMKYYKSSGQLDKKGYAYLDLDSEMIHFYWHGEWKYFDDKRKLYRIALFEKGNLIEVTFGPQDPVYYE